MNLFIQLTKISDISSTFTDEKNVSKVWLINFKVNNSSSSLFLDEDQS